MTEGFFWGGGDFFNQSSHATSSLKSCIMCCVMPDVHKIAEIIIWPNLGSERACHVPHAPLKPAYTCSLEMLHADFQHPLTCGLDFILYHIVHCSDFSQYF